MQNFTKRLQVALESELELITDGQDDLLVQLKTCVEKTYKALGILRSHILGVSFASLQDEITFFKKIKSYFCSLHIFHVYRFHFEVRKPAQEDQLLRNYYMGELEYLQQFFDRHPAEYQYHLAQRTDLDEEYFSRRPDSTRRLIQHNPVDPEFSTSHDYLFSKIQAFKQLQNYICQCIQRLNDPTEIVNADTKKPMKSHLKWTGDKVNLVEVIYGLFYTGQLNNGNADIAEIIRWMEQNLQIDLGKTYRKFLDIRRRKLVSQTRFLDQMRESILRRIEDDNAWKPELKKPHFNN